MDHVLGQVELHGLDGCCFDVSRANVTVRGTNEGEVPGGQQRSGHGEGQRAALSACRRGGREVGEADRGVSLAPRRQGKRCMERAPGHSAASTSSGVKVPSQRLRVSEERRRGEERREREKGREW